MRSIPARVIVLLGMSHQAFPVQDDVLSFDLTRTRPRAGDPGRRQESRQLFLDVLMSARDRLFLSKGQGRPARCCTWRWRKWGFSRRRS